MEQHNEPLVGGSLMVPSTLSLSALDTDTDGKVGKEIKVCMRVIAANANASGSGSSHEGYLLKKKRKSDSWRKYWAVLDSSGTFHYHRNSKTSRPAGKFQVAYASVQRLASEDALAEKQSKKESDVCGLRLSIWSAKRQFVFSAESDAAVEAWVSALDQLIHSKYSDSEISDKAEAARRLLPLINEQECIQKDRYVYLRTVLAQSGLLGYNQPKKLKEGYLDVRLDDDEGAWRKMYFILHKKYLNYYRVEDKKIPYGVVALKFMTSVEEESDGGDCFLLSTPLRTFSLKAKHNVAMKEWVYAMKTASQSKGEIVEAARLAEVGSDAPAIHGKVVFQYREGGRSKSFSLAPGKIATIGRSSSSNLKVSDINVSRNHGKVEFPRDSAPVYYDLGSTKGSFINDHQVQAQALRVGDELRLGDLIFTIQAK
mmetsp:Transcript_3246/g.11327  ORF Transcript_3246/g.11327 Transcript_3246/m.11327 type:complete len:427 (+) Transcript_3246:156-1436(+)